MESPLVAARRATLYGLSVSALAAGVVALVAWLAFDGVAAALVAGGAVVAAGFLLLLSHGSLTRAAYATALLVLGGLLLRTGSRLEHAGRVAEPGGATIVFASRG